jgi:single-strand DNA-binding protein
MIIGNATRDAELRTIPSGRQVAGFSVATNRRWTDQESGEQKEEVQFHEIVAWGKLAEIAGQIVHRGTKIYVEGRLRTRTWEGQDGARREKTEIVAENLIVLTPKGSSTSGDYSPEPQVSPADDSQVKRDEKPVKKEPKEKASDDEINLDEIPF